MTTQSRKIIHIDMDCFYAAIEMRDNPKLAQRPIAVGGLPNNRGVLCTCNYLARQYGVHSAMASSKALQLCPDLVILPVNMEKYKEVSREIQAIFHHYTDLVEPLSLDEAYLDVSDSPHYHGSATLIAQAIRYDIFESQQLTASAGVSCNKLLAKIASDWKKPNGLFVVLPEDIHSFMQSLKIEKLFGVGKVTAKKLHQLGIETCAELQQFSQQDLIEHFGKFGLQLYHQCRGIDRRPVNPHRVRKSLSVETTFSDDINQFETCLQQAHELFERLNARLESAYQKSDTPLHIKNQFIKIKYHDFKQTTAQVTQSELKLDYFLQLLQDTQQTHPNKPIRLLGLGVHFQQDEDAQEFVQQTLL